MKVMVFQLSYFSQDPQPPGLLARVPPTPRAGTKSLSLGQSHPPRRLHCILLPVPPPPAPTYSRSVAVPAVARAGRQGTWARGSYSALCRTDADAPLSTPFSLCPPAASKCLPPFPYTTSECLPNTSKLGRGAVLVLWSFAEIRNPAICPVPLKGV